VLKFLIESGFTVAVVGIDATKNGLFAGCNSRGGATIGTGRGTCSSPSVKMFVLSGIVVFLKNFETNRQSVIA
jgi:hypothetical protein